MDDKQNQVNEEFKKLEEIIVSIPAKLSPEESEKMVPIFSKIYFLTYLSRRPETKRFLNNNYYSICVSFLFEGFISLYKKIPNGSKFLLRSGIENFLKAILYSESLTINNRNFGKNEQTLRKFYIDSTLSPLTSKKINLMTSIKRNYGKVSAISHSAANLTDHALFEFFSDLIMIPNLASEQMFWNDTLDALCEYATYQCYDSFEHWNYFDLESLLKLSFSNSKARKIAEYIIDKKD